MLWDEMGQFSTGSLTKQPLCGKHGRKRKGSKSDRKTLYCARIEDLHKACSKVRKEGFPVIGLASSQKILIAESAQGPKGGKGKGRPGRIKGKA